MQVEMHNTSETTSRVLQHHILHSTNHDPAQTNMAWTCVLRHSKLGRITVHISAGDDADTHHVMVPQQPMTWAAI